MLGGGAFLYHLSFLLIFEALVCHLSRHYQREPFLLSYLAENLLFLFVS
jgi:hypothetical protein